MKRDWDLLRDQLLAIEEGKDLKLTILKDLPKSAPEWTDDLSEGQFIAAMDVYRACEERIVGHLQLLLEAGYIDGLTLTRSMSGEYMYAIYHPRLTMRGHDFLDTMRSKPLWESIKTTAKKKGLELTFDTISALAASALKTLVG